MPGLTRENASERAGRRVRDVGCLGDGRGREEPAQGGFRFGKPVVVGPGHGGADGGEKTETTVARQHSGALERGQCAVAASAAPLDPGQRVGARGGAADITAAFEHARRPRQETDRSGVAAVFGKPRPPAGCIRQQPAERTLVIDRPRRRRRDVIRGRRFMNHGDAHDVVVKPEAAEPLDHPCREPVAGADGLLDLVRRRSEVAVDEHHRRQSRS